MAGMKASTRNIVRARVARRSLTLEASPASGSSQMMYHGTSQARLAISASVDHPAPASQSLAPSQQQRNGQHHGDVGDPQQPGRTAPEAHTQPTRFGMLKSVSSVL